MFQGVGMDGAMLGELEVDNVVLWSNKRNKVGRGKRRSSAPQCGRWCSVPVWAGPGAALVQAGLGITPCPFSRKIGFFWDFLGQCNKTVVLIYDTWDNLLSIMENFVPPTYPPI